MNSLYYLLLLLNWHMFKIIWKNKCLIMWGWKSQIWFKWAVKVISKNASRTSGMSTSYVRHIKLKHQKEKRADLTWNTRMMKKEGYRSHPFHIKYKTTTPLVALMRKWPWIVMAQLRLQGKAYWYALDGIPVLRVQSQPSKCKIQMICG